MVINEQYMAMNDGHEVFVRTYEPSGKPIGHLHVLHGMAEHCGRYHHLAEYLSDCGFYVTMHDHRGHGRTAERSGKLGFFAEEKGFDRVVEDTFEILMRVRKGKDLPKPSIFGHSMGSFIARRFIQLYSLLVDKVILCGTGATTSLHRIGRYAATLLAKKYGKQARSQLLHDLSFGSYNKDILNPKTAYDWLSTVDQEVQKYIKDPYCGFVATIQFIADLGTSLVINDKWKELKKMRTDLPVLFVSGAEDPVGDYGKGVFKVAERFTAVGMEDVTVNLFEGRRHEIINEKNKEEVFKVIYRWLEKG